MTDKDIIRIEGCIKGEKVLCLSCPYRDQYPDCRKYVIRDIFDVAKRQKAEIERLTDEKEKLRCVIEDLSNNTEYAKAEAVKEFAERLKDSTIRIPQHHFTYLEVEQHIDNLIKEMVGAESG